MRLALSVSPARRLLAGVQRDSGPRPAALAVSNRLSSTAAPRTVASRASKDTNSTMTQALDPRAANVLSYWFGEGWDGSKGATYIDPACMGKWYRGGAIVDEEIKTRFSSLLDDMAAGKLESWLEHPQNGLAGVVLMDQFSRNMFRGDAKTYALDPKALAWAKELLATKRCDGLPYILQFFLYMPFDHSEDLADQEECVAQNERLKAKLDGLVAGGDEAAAPLARFLGGTLDYAIRHRNVVAKWGRFPHRNAILGRKSTPEEEAGLADGSIERF